MFCAYMFDIIKYMNNSHHIGLIVSISLTTAGLILCSIVFIPQLSGPIGKFLITMNSEKYYKSLPAATILSNFQGTTTSPTDASIQIGTSSDASINQQVVPDIPKKHEFKLVKNVDVCTMNTLSNQGFEPIQYGVNVDFGTGKDPTCTKNQLVDEFDWILFAREK